MENPNKYTCLTCFAQFEIAALNDMGLNNPLQYCPVCGDMNLCEGLYEDN